MDLRPLTRNLGINLAALGVSALFGLMARFLATDAHIYVSITNRIVEQTAPVMYVAFLFGVPFAMGYMAVTARFYLGRETSQAQPNVAYWIFFPWLPTLLRCYWPRSLHGRVRSVCSLRLRLCWRWPLPEASQLESRSGADSVPRSFRQLRCYRSCS